MQSAVEPPAGFFEVSDSLAPKWLANKTDRASTLPLPPEDEYYQMLAQGQYSQDISANEESKEDEAR